MGHGLCSLKLYPHYLFIGGDLAKLLRSEPAVAFKPPPLQKTVLIGLSKTESSESLKKRDSVYIKIDKTITVLHGNSQNYQLTNMISKCFCIH